VIGSPTGTHMVIGLKRETDASTQTEIPSYCRSRHATFCLLRTLFLVHNSLSFRCRGTESPASARNSTFQIAVNSTQYSFHTDAIESPNIATMNRSASAPKVSMLTIQEVDEPQSPRPLTFEFPSNAVTPNSQPENPFATPRIYPPFTSLIVGADAETQSFVTGEIEILDEKQNYDYRKHLPEVKTTAAPEEFEFMSYIIDGPCEKPWLKEYDPRVSSRYSSH